MLEAHILSALFGLASPPAFTGRLLLEAQGLKLELSVTYRASLLMNTCVTACNSFINVQVCVCLCVCGVVCVCSVCVCVCECMCV